MVLKTSLVLVCFIHYCLCINYTKREARDPLTVLEFTEKIGQSRIINGTNVAEGEFPWQVSLQYKWQGEYHHFCGGSILSNNTILTAAHCLAWLQEDKEIDVYVIAGVTNLTTATDNNRYKLESSLIHPKYNSKKLTGDIALITLKDSITLEDDVTEAVALPQHKQDKIKAKTQVEVTGWGRTEHESFTPWLQKVELSIISNRVCRKAYKPHKRVSKTMICAAGYYKDSCQGDSGGPLVDKDTKVQHGIVSWGIGCALPDYPGVYTKLSNYVNWVKRKL